MRTIALLLILAAAPAWAVSPRSWLTLDADETTAETYNWRGGGGSLQVWGAFTGPPTVTLNWRSFNSAPWESVNATDCTFTAAGFCNFSVGQGRLRIVVTGGAGADIVAALIGNANQASAGSAGAPGGGGGGAGSFDALTGGTNTAAAMLVGSGSSLAASGTGSITGTAIDLDSDGTDEISGVPTGISFKPDPAVIYDLTMQADPSGLFRYRHIASFIDFTNANNILARLHNSTRPEYGLQVGDAILSKHPVTATDPNISPNDLRLTDGLGHDGSAVTFVIGGAQVAAFGANGFGVTDGLRFQLGSATGAPTVLTGGMWFDTDDRSISFYDGFNEQSVAAIFGELEGTTGTITLATENTFTQWTDATVGSLTGGMTGSAATDDLTMPVAGTYLLVLDTSFTGPTNDTITCNIHVNGSPGSVFFERKISTNDVGDASGHGAEDLSANDVLEIFCKNAVADGTGTITISRFALLAERV